MYLSTQWSDLRAASAGWERCSSPYTTRGKPSQNDNPAASDMSPEERLFTTAIRHPRTAVPRAWSRVNSGWDSPAMLGWTPWPRLEGEMPVVDGDGVAHGVAGQQDCSPTKPLHDCSCLKIETMPLIASHCGMPHVFPPGRPRLSFRRTFRLCAGGGSRRTTK